MNAAIRAEVLAARRALPAEEVERGSRAVGAKFGEWAATRPGRFRDRTVSIYADPMKGEVRVAALADGIAREGGRLCHPRVNGETMEMVAPGGGAVLAPADLDVVIVPGVVFGEGGERVGMGKGYYDRYLAAAPQALRVALLFDFQLRPRLEQSPWDQRVDVLITPTRIIELPARARV